MAISNVTPAPLNLINSGDAFSFDIDSTYTSLVIKVPTDTALEVAYSTALGGAQPGYTISVVDNGGSHTFTVARDAGWDVDPQNIYVVEDESGSETTTNISYNLTAETTFPQEEAPYNPIAVGTLIVTDNGVKVRTDVGWIDVVGATVTDLGNGKIRLTIAAGGASDLDSVINFATPDNDVVVPGSDPVVLREPAPGLTSGVLTVSKLIDLTEGALVVETADTGTGIRIHSPNSLAVKLQTAGIKPITNSSNFTFGNRDGIAGSAGGGFNILAGQWYTDGGSVGGNVSIQGGVGAAANGNIQLGVDNTQETLLDAGTNLKAERPLKIIEQAAADADTAGYGQYWVRNDTPNTPMFTDDAGNDFELNGGGTLDQVINAATPDNAVVIPVADFLNFSEAGGGSTNPLLTMTKLTDLTEAALRLHVADAGKALRVSSPSNVGIIVEPDAIRPVTLGSNFVFGNRDGIAGIAGGGFNILAGQRHTDGGSVGGNVSIQGGIGGATNGDIQVGRDNTEQLILGGSSTTNLKADMPIRILEQAAADADIATYGQFWVRNDTPNTPMFTDDAGTDHVLNASGSGDVTGGSTSVVDEVPAYTSATGKAIGRSNLRVSSFNPTIGTRTLAAGALLSGAVIATGGTCTASGAGSVALGYITQASGTASLTSSASGSFLSAFASSTVGTATATSSGSGSFCSGAVSISGAGTATLSTNLSTGAFAQGSVNGATSKIEAFFASGGFAQGDAVSGGIIQVGISAAGGFARGQATGAGSQIVAGGIATFANGLAAAGSVLSATGQGGVALGRGVTNNITASGFGSFAIGDSSAGAIVASATNAAQFGVGTNAVAGSLQVGNTTNGIRLLAAGTTSTVNGSIWCDGTDVFVRTGGVTKNMSNI